MLNDQKVLNQFVGAIIENPKYGFLLQLRDEKAPTYQLCWTLFGGKVKSGETSRNAILRELKEEINLKKDRISHCKVIQRNIQRTGEVQIVFYIQTAAKLTDLSLREGKQMKYVRFNDLFNREFAFNVEEVFQKHLKDI